MRYLNAQKVLPEELIKTIQEYIDGEFLYIPRKNGNEVAWGEKSGAKSILNERNNRILSSYKAGASMTELEQNYYLSEQSLRRIINQKKKLLSKSLHNHL